MDIDDSYPMVVTPAPSSPEDVQNKDLKLLWQGRLRSHRIDEDCLTRDYQVRVIGLCHHLFVFPYYLVSHQRHYSYSFRIPLLGKNLTFRAKKFDFVA